MTNRVVDWLKGKTLAEQNVMFGNILAKIDGYKIKYGLTDVWLDEVKLMGVLYTTVYAKVMQNRATEKQMNDWFKELLNSDDDQVDVPPSPVFQTITVPAGAKKGLYKKFRKRIENFKSNDAYSRADGEDLMIVAPQEGARNHSEDFPELKLSKDGGGNIGCRYKMGNFGGAEVQYREFGQSVWQHGDKSSENEIVFKPDVSVPNALVRIELRAIYLIKNKRVGKWSPIYSETVG